jgi:hypothetical protein
MKRRLGLAVVIPVLLFAVVACGENKGSGIPTASGGTGTASPTATPSLSNAEKEEQGRKFAQCMREHGVEMDDPGPGGPNKIGDPDAATDEKTKAALDACRQYMPNGGEMPKPNAQDLEQGYKHAQCIRDHGVPNFPDPDPDGGMLSPDSGVDPNDPTFKAADEACKALLPGAKGAPTGGPGR